MKCKCNYCGEHFNSKGNLRIHLKQDCKYIKELEKNYVHACCCGKKFSALYKLAGHKATCPIWREYVNGIRNSILTKEFLEKELILHDRTANDISSELSNKCINAGVIIRFAKKYDIKTKTVKESTNNKKTREKFRKTCNEKYGADNVLSRGTVSYEKRNLTIKERYGVDNVFQLDFVKNKIKQTLLRKYGVESAIDLPWRKNNPGRKSKEHKEIEEFLLSKNIKFESEVNGKFKKYNESFKKYYSPIPDIVIEESNIVIEIYGDYWHANPNKYLPNDMINKYKGYMAAKEIWIKDDIRKKQIESFGYHTIILWASQIKRKEYEEILCKELKLNQLKKLRTKTGMI